MSTLDQIVSVTITSDSVNPTQTGFGIPLFVGHHAVFPERVREYDSLTGMVSDGFATSDPLYRMAQAAFSQRNRPRVVKIGRAAIANAVAWRGEVTITSATEDDVVSFTVIGPDGTETNISYTILNGATTTTVATAVELLTEAVTDLGSSSSGAVITLLGDNVGDHFYLADLVNCEWKDTTADANLEDELTAIEVYDNDWYWLACAIESAANVEAVALWTSTRKKIHVASTADQIELSASALLVSLVGDLYDRTFPIFSRDKVSHPAAALCGRLAPKPPGSYTAKFQQLRGVTADTFTSTQRTYLENAARRGNYYESTSNVPHLANGVVPSGEYLDVVVFTDWLSARVQEVVFDLLASNDKIPYTDQGVARVVGEIQSVMDRGVIVGGLAPESGDPDDDAYVPGPTVTAPLVADVSSANRQNRHLPDIKAAGRLAGAIHSTAVEIIVSV
jgi:hypothetical protein